MNTKRSQRCWLPALALVIWAASASAQAPPFTPTAPPARPEAKVLSLDPGGRDYAPIIAPPESVTMRSGVVTLAPGKSVGKHSTKDNEEMVVVLEGEGTLAFADGKVLALKAGFAVYGPPQMEHDVTNTGQGTLRYIFIVARAQ